MVEQKVQRRLAAILAADVVGYSRLMQADEGGTLAALKSRRTGILQPLVSKHHGRIVKVMGDGWLVEFASAVEAVGCAVALQEAMAAANEGAEERRRIVLRIGINLGDVMVEGGDLYGDGVNIAARLEAIAEPGGISVSGKIREEAEGKIACEFVDLGEQTLKNIASPVRVYRVRTATSAAPVELQADTRKPSIAVLPFLDLGGTAEQQYLGDGIAEDIITELSRYRELLVIAGNSSFQFRDKAADTKRIGRELGAEYLVEGGVRKVGERIRITVQLVEAATGAHLWAEKFDRRREDIFEIQDEVSQTIAATLVGRVVYSGPAKARRKPTSQWAAYECYLQGWYHCERYEVEEAIRLLNRAIELDPDYAQAYALLADCELVRYFVDADKRKRDKALAYAQKALALDPDDGVSQGLMGFIQMYFRNFDLAEAHLRKARELNPNSVVRIAMQAEWLTLVGRAQEALEVLDSAGRRDLFREPSFYQVRAMALFGLERYEDVVRNFYDIATPQHYDNFLLAAALAQLGRLREAEAAKQNTLSLSPGFSISMFTAFDFYKNPEDQQRVIAGLRKAGFPE
jgi:TolB-like protein/Flp pilus assembly protein TadD